MSTERDKIVADLRWLSDARKQYCHLSHQDGGPTPSQYWGATEMERHLHAEHQTAEGLADIIAGSNDGMGWLPSWLWDDWEARKQEPTTPTEYSHEAVRKLFLDLRAELSLALEESGPSGVLDVLKRLELL